jgi:hypothetical protein
MAFVIFVIAWLLLLVIHLARGGDFEEDSPAKYLAWLAIAVVLVCAIYTMIKINFMAGVGMVGSLAVFQVRKNAERNSSASHSDRRLVW